MQLTNSLTRRKEELAPPPGPIRMDVCGPTGYQQYTSVTCGRSTLDLYGHLFPDARDFEDGSDGTRTRDLRRDRPAF